KQLGAIMHTDPGAPADVFVIGAFVDVLKPTPAAHVVDQDCREVGGVVLNIGNQSLQGVARLDGESAPSLVRLGAHDGVPALGSVLPDGLRLTFDGVLLVVGG